MKNVDRYDVLTTFVGVVFTIALSFVIAVLRGRNVHEVWASVIMGVGIAYILIGLGQWVIEWRQRER